MAVIQNTNLPQSTSSTQTPKPNYNWAAVQLNLIMLPVGLAVLLIVSLAAVFCHCLRKKKLLRMAKKYKHQERSKIVYSVHSNGVSTVPKSSDFSIKSSPQANLIEKPIAPIHPALVRKKKKKFQVHQPQDVNENHPSHSEKRKPSRRSITPVDERPLSKETTKNRKSPLEVKESRIPIPVKSGKKARRNSQFEPKRSRSVENRRTTAFQHSSSFANNIAIIDRDDPYRIDMNTVRSSRDRRKWEFPASKSIEYDTQNGIRLPPLVEQRFLKTS